ncbi:MAG: hypothetical protein IKV35_06715 [Clostridia bacterium]|nr:hypothetical protein [Clostridia bacterium]
MSKTIKFMAIAVAAALVLLVVCRAGYFAWQRNQEAAMTPEERSGARFETYARQYIEEHELTDIVTIEEPVSNGNEFVYSFYYRVEEMDVSVSLRSMYTEYEDVYIRVMCKEAEESVAIGHVLQIQEWFTGKSFYHVLVANRYIKAKANENNPDYGKTDIDFWGHYTVFYESNLFGYSEPWATVKSDSVIYGFYGKLK